MEHIEINRSYKDAKPQQLKAIETLLKNSVVAGLLKQWEEPSPQVLAALEIELGAVLKGEELELALEMFGQMHLVNERFRRLGIVSDQQSTEDAQ